MVKKKNIRRKKMYSLMRYYFVILFVVTFPSSFHCQYQGQSCFDRQKGESGVCKPMRDCPEVVADIGDGIYPQNCGFEGKDVIVCCPQVGAPPTATADEQNPKPSWDLGPGEKSKQACKNYEKIGYKKERLPSVSDDSVDNCPWESSDIPIFRVTNASFAEFPHMAHIGYGVAPDIAWLCGGALISDRFVLTAAHCLFARAFGAPSVVHLGDVNYLGSNDDYYFQQINVKTLHKHPNFVHPQSYNDIALLELEKPAKLNVHIKPACLHTSEINEPRGLIAGWNRSSFTKNNRHLLKAGVEYFTPEECNKVFWNNRRTLSRGIDENLQICYGSKSIIVDFCEIGTGPLQIYAKDVYCSYYIFGIASFGKGCNVLSIPDVYVKVTSYIKWIEDIVWP